MSRTSSSVCKPLVSRPLSILRTSESVVFVFVIKCVQQGEKEKKGTGKGGSGEGEGYLSINASSLQEDSSDIVSVVCCFIVNGSSRSEFWPGLGWA